MRVQRLRWLQAVPAAAVLTLVIAGCGSDLSSSPAPLLESPDVAPVPQAAATDEVAAGAETALPAYADATYPLLVAMGLPDDEEIATGILWERSERRVQRCMATFGFDYTPEVEDGDDAANQEALNGLSRAQREDWYRALNGSAPGGDSSGSGCYEEAARHTFVFNALGELYAPYAASIMNDEQVVAELDAYDRCVAGLGENADRQQTKEACPQSNLETAKARARRAAEVAFISENEAAVSAFAKESAAA
jgi:hypothetical protein